MRQHHPVLLGLAVLALCGCLRLVAAEAWEDESGADALTSGPIHEAFAQPVPVDQEERFVVAQQPPESIEEIPPEEKPEGENVVWIPGYWQWDDELNDFIWVSGCWRTVPPGMSWVPGYWLDVDEGSEWIAGFWKTEKAQETVYLAAPPATLERGPTAPAPNEDSAWVQGGWVWRSPTLFRRGRYAWRPGYWLASRADWVWVPAYHLYTPRGYIYVDGYWDYAFGLRGALFLPLHFPHRNRLRVGFHISPYLVFDLGFLTQDLFCSPRRHHYYYGDYYGDRYIASGYHPWFETPHRRRSYDPIFIHERWRHRKDRDWAHKQESAYKRHRSHGDTRPPRTYRDMQARVSRRSGPEQHESRVARPLREIAHAKGGRTAFEKLSPKRLADVAAHGRELTTHGRERSRRESPGGQSERGGTGGRNREAPERATPRPRPAAEQVVPPVRVEREQRRSRVQERPAENERPRPAVPGRTPEVRPSTPRTTRPRPVEEEVVPPVRVEREQRRSRVQERPAEVERPAPATTRPRPVVEEVVPPVRVERSHRRSRVQERPAEVERPRPAVPARDPEVRPLAPRTIRPRPVEAEVVPPVRVEREQRRSRVQERPAEVERPAPATTRPRPVVEEVVPPVRVERSHRRSQVQEWAPEAPRPTPSVQERTPEVRRPTTAVPQNAPTVRERRVPSRVTTPPVPQGVVPQAPTEQGDVTEDDTKGGGRNARRNRRR